MAITRAKIRGFPGADRLEGARRAVVAATPRGRKRTRRRRAVGWLTAGLGAGAVLTYFFDPARGKARRAQVRDRARGVARTVGRKLGRTGRYAGTTVGGMRERMTHRTRDYTPANDQTLAAKVESEVLGRADVPKGSINVNVEQGVVALRGTVRTPRQIKQIERLVRRVDGVRDIDNLLHLEGQVAENKRPAYEASVTRVTKSPSPTRS